jgi:glucose/arabinose dehydrogenase
MRRLIVLTALTALLLLPLGAVPTAQAVGLAAGFEEVPVAKVARTTGIAFTPDGRLLISQQTGQVRMVKQGVLLPTPVLDLGRTGSNIVCGNYERGLLGEELDPQFAQNGYIYLFYTFCPPGASPTNRVARFTMRGDTIDPASQLVLLDNITATGIYHQGGGLAIGADGYLYIGTGDNRSDQGQLSARLSSLNGKILRIDRATGRGVPGNPFFGTPEARRCGVAGSTGTSPCEEIASWGLRNPFRIAMRPGTNEFYINDVGNLTWEEVNRGAIGFDYGHPRREGPCPANGPCTNPQPDANLLVYYNHRTSSGIFGGGCSAVTGGVFVPRGVWPAAYDNNYLFGDYTCGKIFRVQPGANGTPETSLFVGNRGQNSVSDFAFGPDGSGRQALYYANYSSEIKLIRYTGSVNRAPEVVASASPRSGRTPLTVTFDGRGSSDPDGQPLSYRWDFGDGAGADGALVTYTYNTTGTFTATLTVRDNAGGSAVSDPIVLNPGNLPPEVTISAPDLGAGYRVGQRIDLQGAARDPEDGMLSGSRLTWVIDLHHEQHTHPFLEETDGQRVAITTISPEDLNATTTSFLRVYLTATDSKGLTATASLDLTPQLVSVTLDTNPPGLFLCINGVDLQAPVALTSWPGYPLDVVAPGQLVNGERLIMTRWDEHARGARRLITPSSNASYRAFFDPALANLFFPALTR